VGVEAKNIVRTWVGIVDFALLSSEDATVNLFQLTDFEGRTTSRSSSKAEPQNGTSTNQQNHIRRHVLHMPKASENELRLMII
jgi:hypothetical protein